MPSGCRATGWDGALRALSLATPDSTVEIEALAFGLTVTQPWFSSERSSQSLYVSQTRSGGNTPLPSRQWNQLLVSQPSSSSVLADCVAIAPGPHRRNTSIRALEDGAAGQFCSSEPSEHSSTPSHLWDMATNSPAVSALEPAASRATLFVEASEHSSLRRTSERAARWSYRPHIRTSVRRRTCTAAWAQLGRAAEGG